MKLVMNKEYELKLCAVAAEKIEEHYQKALADIFGNNKVMAKDVSFIIWSSMQEEITLDEAKKQFSKHYTYPELLVIFNSLLGADPNVAGVETVTEPELSNALPATE